jgi:hypothetical protein
VYSSSFMAFIRSSSLGIHFFFDDGCYDISIFLTLEKFEKLR